MYFTPRLTIPEKGNKFYNTKSVGGYSSAIVGKPTCDGLNTLSNCVGYAYGRYHEINGDTTMHYLKPVNAEMFIDYADKSLKIGMSPKLGACMVWQKGTPSGSDGAGHVAIVEQINADGSIVTSESGWNSTKPFWTKTRKNDGNWGQATTYTFLGFIYQPKEYEPQPTPSNVISFPVTAVKKGMGGEAVKQVQTILKGLGYYTMNVDGSAGGGTDKAIRAYQKAYGLTQNGIFDKVCWEKFLDI